MTDFILGLTNFVCSVITIIIINRFFFDRFKNWDQFSPAIFRKLPLYNFLICTLISILFVFIVGGYFIEWGRLVLVILLIIFILVGTISGVINGFILRHYIRSKFKNSKYNLKIIPFIFILALMVVIPSFIIMWEKFIREYESAIKSEEYMYKLSAENRSLKQKLDQIENDLKNTRKNSGWQQEIDPLEFLYEKPTKDIQILKTGKFFGGDINDGAEKLVWYGLFEQEGKFILKKTKILIEPTSWGGDEGNQKSGKLVTTTIETGAPIIFITGLKGIQEGEIESVKLKNQILPIGEAMDLSFNGYRLICFAYGKYYPSTNNQKYYLGLRYDGYSPKYKSNNQIFAGIEEGSWPGYSFYWAGDIDRDGLLDLIMKLNLDEGGKSRIELFLSSRAEEGQLIKRVSEFIMRAFMGC